LITTYDEKQVFLRSSSQTDNVTKHSNWNPFDKWSG